MWGITVEVHVLNWCTPDSNYNYLCTVPGDVHVARPSQTWDEDPARLLIPTLHDAVTGPKMECVSVFASDPCAAMTKSMHNPCHGYKTRDTMANPPGWVKKYPAVGEAFAP